LFVDNFVTEIIGSKLRYGELISSNEILESEEASLVSSSVAED
jgi:hypothetical protein